MIQIIQKRPSPLERVGRSLGSGIGGAINQFYERKNRESTIDEYLSHLKDLSDEERTLIRGVALEDMPQSVLSAYAKKQQQLAKGQPGSVKPAYLDKGSRELRSELKARGRELDPELYTRLQPKVLERLEAGEPIARAIPGAIEEDDRMQAALERIPGPRKSAFLGLGTKDYTPEDIEQLIPELQAAHEVLGDEGFQRALQQKGWSPEQIQRLQQQTPPSEMLTAEANAVPNLAQQVLTPQDQAELATVDESMVPAEDRAMLLGEVEEPPAVKKARERVSKLSPEQINPDDMPIADLLALSGDQFNTLPFAKKAAISKRIGEEAQEEVGKQALAGLTFGATERARKAVGQENVVATPGGAAVARMVGEVPYYAGIGGAGLIKNALQFGARTAGVQGLTRLIEHGETPSIQQAAMDFGLGALGSVALEGGAKLVGKMIKAFVKGGTPRNDPLLLEFKELAEMPKPEKKKALEIGHEPTEPKPIGKRSRVGHKPGSEGTLTPEDRAIRLENKQKRLPHNESAESIPLEPKSKASKLETLRSQLKEIDQKLRSARNALNNASKKSEGTKVAATKKAARELIRRRRLIVEQIKRAE